MTDLVPPEQPGNIADELKQFVANHGLKHVEHVERVSPANDMANALAHGLDQMHYHPSQGDEGSIEETEGSDAGSDWDSSDDQSILSDNPGEGFFGNILNLGKNIIGN